MKHGFNLEYLYWNICISMPLSLKTIFKVKVFMHININVYGVLIGRMQHLVDYTSHKQECMPFSVNANSYTTGLATLQIQGTLVSTRNTNKNSENLQIYIKMQLESAKTELKGVR